MTLRRLKNRAFLRSAARIAVGLLCAVCCTVAIAILLPSAKPPSVAVVEPQGVNPLPTTIGFSDGDIYGMEAADVDRTVGSVAQSDAKTIRLMIPWSLVEHERGQFRWADLDRTVDAAAAEHLAIVGVINSTPTWAIAPGGSPTSGRPETPAAFGDFAAKVATRYKGTISVYQIWNEPNASIFYSPSPDPVGYTDLLKAAYPRIKAADPTVPVIAAGLAAVVDRGSAAMNPVRFLTQMYAAGAKDYFDALAYHPYQYTLKFSDGITVANSPVRQLMQMRQTMIANGDEDKRIWATEYGEPTSQTDEAGQKAFITDMYTKWQELPFAGPLMIYTTRDRDSASADPDDTFGLFKTDWTPKLAAQALQFAIRTGPAKSAEFARFSTITEPAFGTVLSPVFRASPSVWAQFRTVDAIYETPNGYVASPLAVAQKALLGQGAPVTPFAGGWQDFIGIAPFRIWWSEATGAHWAGAPFALAWAPRLGLATTDETPVNGGIRVEFEHGYMNWTRQTGVETFFVS
jgi:polysaccharide biosynthesis protein PslG